MLKLIWNEVVGVQAELVFTGTELLLGQVENTHGQYLGRELSALGVEVILHTVVGDNSHNLKDVFAQALKRSSLIITTGGLGPTTDDLTKETMADLLKLKMVLDKDALSMMKDYFHRRGLNMPEILVKQAYIPIGAKPLPNPVGSAPGILLENDGRVIIMLPGPPNEMREIYRNSVKPYLVKRGIKGQVTFSKVFKLTGISESAVQERLSCLGGQSNPGLAYIAKPGQVHVRISASAPEGDLARLKVNDLAEKVRGQLSGYIFGVDDDVLEETVGNLLLQKGVSVSVAESCTGGLITQRLTNIRGSSRFLNGGVVANSFLIKNKLLGVESEILKEHGVVSKQTAIAMAEGVHRVMGSGLGLAVTGITDFSDVAAGMPLGLVYIALAAPDGTCCREFRFPGQSWGIRWGTANAGLNMIRLYLLAQ